MFTYAIPLFTFTITPDAIYGDVKVLLFIANLLFIELRRSEERKMKIFKWLAWMLFSLPMLLVISISIVCKQDPYGS